MYIPYYLTLSHDISIDSRLKICQKIPVVSSHLAGRCHHEEVDVVPDCDPTVGRRCFFAVQNMVFFSKKNAGVSHCHICVMG